MQNQKSRILSLLKSKEWVTQKELNTICFRYGARLWDLRQDGYSVLTKQGKKGQFFYSLLGQFTK
jgi:hypothetical protein